MESIRRRHRPDSSGGVMKVFRSHQAQDLHEWLEITTKDLVAPAKERIRTEIEAHYAEAAAAHLVEGLSESDARRETMAELGDAQEAAKRFRRQHLTVNEAKKIERDFIWSRWELLGTYLSYFLIAGLLLLPSFLDHDKSGIRNSVELLAQWSFGCIIDPTVRFIMGRHKSKSIGFLYLTRVVVIIFWSYILYFMIGFFGFSFWVFSGILLIFLLLFASHIRIGFKLRHVSNIWDEIPLRNE
jgi:hypothetical protein